VAVFAAGVVLFWEVWVGLAVGLAVLAAADWFSPNAGTYASRKQIRRRNRMGLPLNFRSSRWPRVRLSTASIRQQKSFQQPMDRHAIVKRSSARPHRTQKRAAPKLLDCRSPSARLRCGYLPPNGRQYRWGNNAAGRERSVRPADWWRRCTACKIRACPRRSRGTNESHSDGNAGRDAKRGVSVCHREAKCRARRQEGPHLSRGCASCLVLAHPMDKEVTVVRCVGPHRAPERDVCI
jgi:hypothetical protein